MLGSKCAFYDRDWLPPLKPSDSSQWEDLESTDLDACRVTMLQETCALRSRSCPTVAAPCDFLRLTGQRERSLSQSGHIRGIRSAKIRRKSYLPLRSLSMKRPNASGFSLGSFL